MSAELATFPSYTEAGIVNFLILFPGCDVAVYSLKKKEEGMMYKPILVMM